MAGRRHSFGVAGPRYVVLDAAQGEALFVAELATIEQAIAFTCRRSGLRNADGEDFASYVKLRLIENDYAVVRKYEGRCKFAGYVGIVIQRMLLDYRIHLWGKWHASSEATRLGPEAVALESLLHRDELTLDEALSTLRRTKPAMNRDEAQRIAAQLPRRSRRRRGVALEAISEELAVPSDEPRGSSPFAQDRTALSRQLASLIRSAIEQLPNSERLLFRLRFEAGMRVADIARVLHVEQKPLYRRIENLVQAFRRQLEFAGICAEDAAALIGDPASDLDFGFSAENGALRPSGEEGAERKSEEMW